MSAGVASLYIINRNGSLIYDQDFNGGGTAHLSSNDKIRLSSTFHGISAIASQISPVREKSGSGPAFGFLQPSGILKLDADTFQLQCFHTPTGIKLLAIVIPPIRDKENLLRQTYAIYSDYVMKNPFYEVDMPIRCEPFDREIRRIFGDVAPRGESIISGRSQ
eukprot:TRINITY_DN17100_c0_g2_i2.p1 TRINITY_DN17100_c0_g2~~TRINITY_DN17100_c0_g2_i2.p1  ORF type:complete len:176 (-),score=22.24 TRINITY_DN17100_c0_g2_i2:249-737(-)